MKNPLSPFILSLCFNKQVFEFSQIFMITTVIQRSSIRQGFMRHKVFCRCWKLDLLHNPGLDVARIRQIRTVYSWGTRQIPTIGRMAGTARSKEREEERQRLCVMKASKATWEDQRDYPDHKHLKSQCSLLKPVMDLHLG